jgi:hypothetical protein
MIKIADNPAVRAQLAQATSQADEIPRPRAKAPEYARAPAAPGPQPAGSRPPATQGSSR